MSVSSRKILKRLRPSRPEPLVVAAALLGGILAVVGVSCQMSVSEGTLLELTQPETGRKIFSAVLQDGEEVVFSWRNSLFGLDVAEVFEARRGELVLDRVTFADPRGTPPPEVSPADVEDLYQTGGPFTAHGIGKAFRRVTYRVAEIGNPTMKIRTRVIDFKQEVGFGGAVLLTASPFYTRRLK
jgi:hypothetical protein